MSSGNNSLPKSDPNFKAMLSKIVNPNDDPEPIMDHLCIGPVKAKAARQRKTDDTKITAHNLKMGYATPSTPDADFETIDSRMVKRVEYIEESIFYLRQSINDQKKVIWRAAGTTIAVFIALFAIFMVTFDSGRDAAKIATDAQQQTSVAKK